jgi:hypothetical protein
VKKRLLDHWREYAESNNVIMPNTSPICGQADKKAAAQQQN